MESQPQNPEFRDKPEGIHQCIYMVDTPDEAFLWNCISIVEILLYT